MFRLPDLKLLLMLGKETYPGALSFNDVISSPGPAQVREIADIQDSLQFDDPINIQFTSVRRHCDTL